MHVVEDRYKDHKEGILEIKIPQNSLITLHSKKSIARHEKGVLSIYLYKVEGC